MVGHISSSLLLLWFGLPSLLGVLALSTLWLCADSNSFLLFSEFTREVLLWQFYFGYGGNVGFHGLWASQHQFLSIFSISRKWHKMMNFSKMCLVC